MEALVSERNSVLNLNQPVEIVEIEAGLFGLSSRLFIITHLSQAIGAGATG
jgi:hypothetical protein